MVRRRPSDMAERFTGPCRECMEWLGEMGSSADDVYSCIAGCTSRGRALESGALPLTSASSRGRQSVNARAAVIYPIHGQTDGSRIDVLQRTPFPGCPSRPWLLLHFRGLPECKWLLLLIWAPGNRTRAVSGAACPPLAYHTGTHLLCVPTRSRSHQDTHHAHGSPQGCVPADEHHRMVTSHGRRCETVP